MPGKLAVSPVYAIVVNYNGWRDTIECLESLLRSDYPSLRVIVCDNGSSDGSIERMRAWANGELDAHVSSPASLAPLTATTIPKPISVTPCTATELERMADEGGDNAKVILVSCATNLGFAGANNVGLRYVWHREPDSYALLLNNDTVTAPDAISAMVEQAERDPGVVGAVGATILRYHQPQRIETLGGARLNRLNGMMKAINGDTERNTPRPVSLDVDYITGCCMLVPRSVIERVGLMDERYFLYGEDADWGLRMRRSGFSLAYCAAAEVWHKGGASVVHRSAMHDYYAVRATLMLVHKHFPPMLPIALVYSFWRSLVPKIARRQWKRLRAASRGYRDFLLQAVQRNTGDRA